MPFSPTPLSVIEQTIDDRPKIKPPAPSTVIQINGTSGDDDNDGFTGAIQTFARLQEILNSYDWEDNAVIVDITGNYTSNEELDLSGEACTNLPSLLFNQLSTGVLTLTNNCSFSNFNTLIIRDITLDSAGTVALTNIDRLITTDINVNTGSTTSSKISVDYCGEIELNFGTVNNPIDSTRLIDAEYTDYVKVDVNTFTTVIFTDALIRAEKVREVEFDAGIASYSGSPINALASPNIVLNSIIGGTIPNIFPNNYTLDGVLTVTLQAFDDDAAAGTGGLTTGELYQTTGSGAAPLNAAGIVMVKQ